MTTPIKPPADPSVDADVLVVTPAGPRLGAATCDDCGTTTFPAQGSCPRCTGERMRRRLIGPDGRLWSWTVQRFAPQPPYLGAADFVPFGVGYVDVGGEVLVESRLTVADPGQLCIGMPLTLTCEPLGDGDARRVVPAFTPAEQTP